jgi:hypothetical protein
MSPRFNSFLLLRDEQNSKCVWGAGVAIIKCIYLSPTYLHFMQDIEDRCLWLTGSMSFVEVPFQEHRMTKKHHMDQNPYISSLCPKLGVVSDNMTRGDDMVKSSCPTDPRWGRSARVWHQWNYAFNTCHVKLVRRESEVGKLVRPYGLLWYPQEWQSC